MYGRRKNIIASKTSPAKILPNNLKENDIILDISDKSSNIPTKNFKGLAKFKNFLMWVNVPKTTIPKKLVTSTDITANAKVKFKSAAGDLNNGTLSLPFLNIKEPTPGSSPSQFEVSIKIKIVAIKGKYFSAASSVPKTDFISPKSASIPISTIPCTFPGISLILFLKTTEKIIKIKETIIPKSSPLVTLKPPMLNNSCAFNDIASIKLKNQALLYINLYKLTREFNFLQAKTPLLGRFYC